MKPDDKHGCDRQGWADQKGQVWQHEPRPCLGAALVVLLSRPVRDLLAGASFVYADHLAQEQRGDFSGNKPLVGFSSDAVELCRASDIEPVPEVLLELGVG